MKVFGYEIDAIHIEKATNWILAQKEFERSQLFDYLISLGVPEFTLRVGYLSKIREHCADIVADRLTQKLRAKGLVIYREDRWIRTNLSPEDIKAEREARTLEAAYKLARDMEVRYNKLVGCVDSQPTVIEGQPIKTYFNQALSFSYMIKQAEVSSQLDRLCNTTALNVIRSHCR